MTKQRTIWALILVSLILLGLGSWALYPSVGWLGILGAWLLLWGNGVNLWVVKLQEGRRLDKQTRFLEIVERFEERHPPKPSKEQELAAIEYLKDTDPRFRYVLEACKRAYEEKFHEEAGVKL